MASLAKKDLSAHEVERILVAKGLQAGGGVDHLVHRGFVNDERLAHHIVEKNVGRGAKGIVWLEATMSARGIDPELAQRAIAQFNELDIAQEVLSLNPGKSARFLAGRGFSEVTIEKILENSL